MSPTCLISTPKRQVKGILSYYPVSVFASSALKLHHPGFAFKPRSEQYITLSPTALQETLLTLQHTHYRFILAKHMQKALHIVAKKKICNLFRTVQNCAKRYIMCLDDII